jgi:rare lipoprotein A
MASVRRQVPLLVALTALVLLAGCARAVMTTPAVPPVADMEEVGMASWYGAPHHGRRTASGEVFDMNQLTAAHRTLPFGTRLLVTNRDTNQSAEVRVNDRGPFVEGRILDVSYAAGLLLGAVGPGLIPVRVRVLSLPGRSSWEDRPDPAQVAAFE